MLPVGQAGRDELLNVWLDVAPWLAGSWRRCGQLWSEVAGRDGSNDGAFGDGLVVVDDYDRGLASCGKGSVVM